MPSRRVLVVDAIKVSAVQLVWATCFLHNSVRPSLTSFTPASPLLPHPLTGLLSQGLLLKGGAPPEGANAKKTSAVPLVVGSLAPDWEARLCLLGKCLMD